MPASSENLKSRVKEKCAPRYFFIVLPCFMSITRLESTTKYSPCEPTPCRCSCGPWPTRQNASAISPLLRSRHLMTISPPWAQSAVRYGQHGHITRHGRDLNARVRRTVGFQCRKTIVRTQSSMHEYLLPRSARLSWDLEADGQGDAETSKHGGTKLLDAGDAHAGL